MTLEPRPTVIINPGSGPVPNATYEQALANMDVLIADAGAPQAKITPGHSNYDDGRYLFVVTLNGRESEVLMPGLPLEKVRFLRKPEQNIWDFPRLYVDGSSWVWCYGRDMLNDALFGEDEEL